MREGVKTRPKFELEITGDGSHTLFVPELNEHYHSVHGAIAESMHIFISAGFRHICKSSGKIRILEIGFGTGLNALLTCIEAEKLKCNVEYAAIELNPLHKDIYSTLKYDELIDYQRSHEIFLLLHESPWKKQVQISKGFILHKINISLKDFLPEKEFFDLVYFDAFGPDVQPEMWSEEVFFKMFEGLKKDGVLVTYSTKGTVKRNLKNAGFAIEKLPGPKGKREILRASRI